MPPYDLGSQQSASKLNLGFGFMYVGFPGASARSSGNGDGHG